jgi:hypothetical protein
MFLEKILFPIYFRTTLICSYIKYIQYSFLEQASLEPGPLTAGGQPDRDLPVRNPQVGLSLRIYQCVIPIPQAGQSIRNLPGPVGHTPVGQPIRNFTSAPSGR